LHEPGFSNYRLEIIALPEPFLTLEFFTSQTISRAFSQCFCNINNILHYLFVEGLFLDLEKIANEIRTFEGLTRKHNIADIVNIFETVRSEYGNCIADFGDDAAVLDAGNEDVILFAADGIWGRLLHASPWWAGYSSVLVNVNDISAMGGKPLGMVNVLSSSNKKACIELLNGIKDGIAKFGVPMVGGHLHPDTPHLSLSVAIVGTAKRDCLIRSDTAQTGDLIIAAYDMEGRVGPNSPYSWDTTTMKTPAEVREKFMVMQTIGEAHAVTAGKDISNPGTLGTLGMLLETSHKGAVVDLAKIPVPKGVDFIQWLKIYPATGYIVTAQPGQETRCIELFEAVGITARVIGEITDNSKLIIKHGEESLSLFDFKKDTVTGIV
jgi:putative methanogenesis marker protein 2